MIIVVLPATRKLVAMMMMKFRFCTSITNTFFLKRASVSIIYYFDTRRKKDKLPMNSKY